MRIERWKRSLIGLALVCGLAGPAAAADPPGDIAVSYSVLRDQDIEETFPVGWLVAGAAHLNNWFGVVGEVGGNYKSTDVGDVNVNLSVHAFLGGVRVSGGPSSVRPFGQVLVGAARAKGGAEGISASDTGFVVQPGVGLDFSIGNGLAVRLQGDYRAIRNEGDTGSELRFAGGLVFVF